jgi:hypothetical protein
MRRFVVILTLVWLVALFVLPVTVAACPQIDAAEAPWLSTSGPATFSRVLMIGVLILVGLSALLRRK